MNTSNATEVKIPDFVCGWDGVKIYLSDEEIYADDYDKYNKLKYVCSDGCCSETITFCSPECLEKLEKNWF